MVQCKELGTGSLQGGYSIFLTLTVYQLGDLRHALDQEALDLLSDQEDAGDIIFTILLISII